MSDEASRKVVRAEVADMVRGYAALEAGNGDEAQRCFAKALKAHAIANKWPEAQALLRGTAADPAQKGR